MFPSEQPKKYILAWLAVRQADRQTSKFVVEFLKRMIYFIKCVGFSCNFLSDSILTNCMFPEEEAKKYPSVSQSGSLAGRQRCFLPIF